MNRFLKEQTEQGVTVFLFQTLDAQQNTIGFSVVRRVGDKRQETFFPGFPAAEDFYNSELWDLSYESREKLQY